MLQEETNNGGEMRVPICLEKLYDELAMVIEKIGDKQIVESGIMSSATLWRWKGRVNQKAPTGDLVLSLLKKASGLKSVDKIAEHFGGEIRSFLEASFAATFKYDQDKVIHEATDILEDEYDFQIFFMCCTERGASLDEIIYSLGRIASKKANLNQEQLTDDLITSMGAFAGPKVTKLEKFGLISLKGKFYKCDNTEIHISDENGLSHSLKMFSNVVNPDSWRNGTGIFYLSADSVEPHIAKMAVVVLQETFLGLMKMFEENKTDSETAVPFTFCVGGESLIAIKQSELEKELH